MGPLRRFSNRILGRSDRGASGVEYGLVLALLLTGTTASVEMMDERIGANYEETANDIGQQDLDYFEVTTTACNDCETTTTTTTTTTAAPTTTTTAAPTTTSTTSTTTTTTTTTTTSTTTTTTTTTTAAPTTTTTTTTVPAEAAAATWEDRSRYSYSCYCYQARARIYLDDAMGDDLAYATVSVTFTLADGTEATGTKTANSSGRVNFRWNDLSADDFPVTVEITAIEKDGDTYTPDVPSFELNI